jgi:hypothetical protein
MMEDDAVGNTFRARPEALLPALSVAQELTPLGGTAPSAAPSPTNGVLT